MSINLPLEFTQYSQAFNTDAEATAFAAFCESSVVTSAHVASPLKLLIQKIQWRFNECQRVDRCSADRCSDVSKIREKIAKHIRSLENELINPTEGDRKFVDSLFFLQNTKNRQVALVMRRVSDQALHLKSVNMETFTLLANLLKGIFQGNYGSKILHKLVGGNPFMLMKHEFLKFILVLQVVAGADCKKIVWFKNLKQEDLNLINDKYKTFKERCSDPHEALYLLAFREELVPNELDQLIMKTLSQVTLTDDEYKPVLELMRPYFLPSLENLKEAVYLFFKCGDVHAALRVVYLCEDDKVAKESVLHGLYKYVFHDAGSVGKSRLLGRMEECKTSFASALTKTDSGYKMLVQEMVVYFATHVLCTMQANEVSEAQTKLCALMMDLNDQERDCCFDRCLQGYKRALLTMNMPVLEPCSSWYEKYKQKCTSSGIPGAALRGLALHAITFEENRFDSERFMQFYAPLDPYMRRLLLQSVAYVVAYINTPQNAVRLMRFLAEKLLDNREKEYLMMCASNYLENSGLDWDKKVLEGQTAQALGFFGDSNDLYVIDKEKFMCFYREFELLPRLQLLQNLVATICKKNRSVAAENYIKSLCKALVGYPQEASFVAQTGCNFLPSNTLANLVTDASVINEMQIVQEVIQRYDAKKMQMNVLAAALGGVNIHS